MSAAVIPPWKQALLDRKKKQEEEEKAKSEQAKKAKLASLPAWKRAIVTREKPSNTSVQQPSTSSASSNKITVQDKSEKWQVAVKRVKGPDSPILNQKQQQPSFARVSSPLSSSPLLAKERPKHSSQSFSGGSPRSETKKQVVNRWNPVKSTTESHSTSSTAAPLPPVSSNTRSTSFSSKFAGSNTAPSVNTNNSSSTQPARSNSGISNRAANLSNRSASFNTASVSSSNKRSTNSNTQSSAPTPAAEEDEDPSFANLPAWKKALILRKREAAQKKVEVNHEGTDETDSGPVPPPSSQVSPISSSSSEPAPVQPSSVKPEVVNRIEREGNETSSPRLIEQEGVTLHPPVYKEVDQWANVNEDDKMFQDLPLWKQALIKRRRADIANRSGQPVTVSPTLPPVIAASSPEEPASKKKESTSKKEQQKKSTKSSTAGKTSKKIFTSKNNRKNVTKSRGEKDKPLKATTTKKAVDHIKPYRRAPLQPVKKEEEEPMFTYNFKKSSRHTLDTGNTSSDSTDSDLEEAVVTNLDESSDEGDSGIVLQSYSSAKSSSSSSAAETRQNISDQVTPLKKQSSKSALSRSKKKHLRRVSWSDSQLTSEHYYPKYDYSDYDERDHMQTASSGSSNQDGELSHRLHPSLRATNDTNPDLYNYGYNASPSSKNGSSEGSFTNFVPSSLSSYTPVMVAGYHDTSVDEDPAEEVSMNPPSSYGVEQQDDNGDDFYADMTSNTAALLW